MTNLNLTAQILVGSWKDRIESAKSGPKSKFTFEFLDDLSPIPLAEVIETYGLVMAETSVDLVVKEALLPLWLHGMLYQKKPVQTAAFAPLTFPGLRFKWHLFDKWQAKFHQEQCWPEGWDHLHVQKNGKRVASPEQLVAMLDNFISHKITSRRSAQSIQPGSLVHKRGFHLSAHGDRNTQIVSGLEAIVDLSDWRTHPPFFPGDSSRISPNPPTSS